MSDINPQECVKVAPNVCGQTTTSSQIVTGCTDATAFNYDPNANANDGSCCFISGCTNDDYAEYDVTACYDDGSCATLLNTMVTYCTDRTTLLPPNASSSYVYGAQSNLSLPCIEIEKHSQYVLEDQRIYRYPMLNDMYNFDAIWWLYLHHQSGVVDSNSNPLTGDGISSPIESSLPLNYPAIYTQKLFNENLYYGVGFSCPEDFIIWANSIVDNQSNALATTFSSDYNQSFGTGYNLGSSPMVQMVAQKINEPIAQGGGGYEVGGSVQSALGGDVPVFESDMTSMPCAQGVNTSIYS